MSQRMTSKIKFFIENGWQHRWRRKYIFPLEFSAQVIEGVFERKEWQNRIGKEIMKSIVRSKKNKKKKERKK